jgi:hypothetical protein
MIEEIVVECVIVGLIEAYCITVAANSIVDYGVVV